MHKAISSMPLAILLVKTRLGGFQQGTWVGASRIFRRLQFVRRSFRDEQNPKQVLASLACGSPETRERAIRKVHEHRADHASEWEAMRSIADMIGCTAEMLRRLGVERRLR